MNKKNIDKIYPFITIILLIIVWQILANAIDLELIMPTPESVGRELINLLQDKNFYLSVWSSLLRVVYSFTLSFAIALIMAVFSNLNNVIKKLLSPIIVILRALPTMSIILFCVLWLISTNSPIAIAMVVMLPLIYSNLMGAFDCVDKKLVDMSKVYKVNKWYSYKKLYLPQIIMAIFSSLSSLLAFNVKIVIAGEALAQTATSLGGALSTARMTIETANLFAYTIVIILVSFILEVVFKLLKRLVFKLWI